MTAKRKPRAEAVSVTNLELVRSEGHHSPPGAAPRPRLEARVDGERVVIEAEREIVLQCGEASLTLCRDGKVIVRGTYVETYSQGVNRIKGGTVRIN